MITGSKAVPAGLFTRRRRVERALARRAGVAIAATACIAFALLVDAAAGAAGPVARAANATSGPVAHRANGASARPALPAFVSYGGGSRRIPTSFFGLSVEYKELGTYLQSGPLFERMLALVRPRDGGPMLLRIGGKSADHVWWKSATQRPPQWVTTIGHDWLAGLSGLVSRADLRVVLDLNLAVHSPAMAAQFASAAVKELPRSTIAGLEVGNEPDLYWRQPWLEKQRIPTTSRNVPLHWATNYSPLDYRRDYEDYARKLAATVPGIPLGAPEIISSKLSWLSEVTALGPLDPRFMSIHRYASSTCWPPTSPYYPTIPLLLASPSSTGLAQTTETAVQFAHSHHTALRLTEVNSISCGGNSGVANSFATALWAPDLLFEMLNAGVDGINWHIRPSTLNAPFNLDHGGVVPLPELYGLAMFAQVTHGPARLLSATLTSSPGLELKAWAVRERATSNVLLINKGARAADVRLPGSNGATSAAIVRRLEAPGIGSTTGVRFAGRWIGTDGRWHGREIATRIRERGGFYYVPVPGYSAAAVSLGS
jgi:hypothetical protein